MKLEFISHCECFCKVQSRKWLRSLLSGSPAVSLRFSRVCMPFVSLREKGNTKGYVKSGSINQGMRPERLWGKYSSF